MINPPIFQPKSSLEEVRAAFENWRKTRPKRAAIPEFLWNAAIRLSKENSVFKISKALRLNYAHLKRRIQGDSLAPMTPPTFIELDIGKRGGSDECVLEMENDGGKKMRIQFRGTIQLDLVGLSRAFWESWS